MAKVLIGGNSNIRSKAYDSTLSFTMVIDGSVLSRVMMPPFDVQIYVENRVANQVHCTYDGATAANCTISEAGGVVCFLPANTFPVGGKLVMFLETQTPETGFADGIQNDGTLIDTGYIIHE